MNVTKKKKHRNCSPKFTVATNWRGNMMKQPPASKPIIMAKVSRIRRSQRGV